MTVNQITELFRDIANRHLQINSFKPAQDFNIDAEEALLFPVLVVNPTGSEMPKKDNGFTSYSISFSMQVLDLMNKDRDNEDDVISDTLTILREVVNEFSTHPDYMEDALDITGNISFTPIRGGYDSDVSGWRCSITFESPNNLSYCTSPLKTK